MDGTTREPAPLSYFTPRIKPGDVGYIRRGCFHLLFSAGNPPGSIEFGINVPHTFKQLDVGPIIHGQPRLPGCLPTITVRKTQPRIRVSMHPIPCVRSVASVPFRTSDLYSRVLESCSSIPFRLTGNRGAALLTKYLTYREDVQLEQMFEEYTKEHYDSWVTFARDRKHGSDVKPVLVTGVDMTRDFAMISYSNHDIDDLTAEFITSAPGASAWGAWQTTGGVYTNCGPQPCRPPSPTQATDSAFSGNGHPESVSTEYNQASLFGIILCVRGWGSPGS